MMHKNREWQVVSVENAEMLAKTLTEIEWVSCSGFMLDHMGRTLVYLNDSVSGGVQEYGVLLPVGGGAFEQIESITFGWLDKDAALAHIGRLHGCDLTSLECIRVSPTPVMKNPAEHKCPLCT